MFIIYKTKQNKTPTAVVVITYKTPAAVVVITYKTPAAVVARLP